MAAAPSDRSHPVKRPSRTGRPSLLVLFLAVQVLGIGVATSAGLVAHHTVLSQPAPGPPGSSATQHPPSPGLAAAAHVYGQRHLPPAGHTPATTTTTAKAKPKTTTTTTRPTTTTPVAPGGQGPHPLALGFAVFQPTAQFQNYQSVVGTLPDFLEWYQSWPTSAADSAMAPLYWGSQEQLVEADHLTPLISWGTGTIPLSSIVAGADDAIALGPAVALAKSYPGTLYIRLDWEMNGAWAPYSPNNSDQPQGETPATFVAMWQHVVNYFRVAGVTNVRWVWSPNVDGGTGTMAAYYPGDAYVDDVALDGYNYAYTEGAEWQTPQQIFGASYAELESITHKPVIIAETSSVEANTTEASEGLSKALWIQQLSSYLPTLSNVIAVCWFHQPALVNGYGTVDFGVDTSSAALNAWEQYFVMNPEYLGKLP